MPPKTLSFVIPCYRSAHTIGGVVEEIESTVASRAEEFDYEIILVNDGSPDDTARVITDLCRSDPRLVFVNLSRNFGQHSALMAGFAQVRGDIVICLDDDGQTPANECFSLIDKVLEGNDIVFAQYGSKQHSWYRKLGSRFNAACSHFFFDQPKDVTFTSYYACLRFVVDNALRYHNPFPYIGGLLFQSISTYASVPVRHRKRVDGKSGYSLRKLVGLWASGITAFSIKPLRFADYLGMVTAVIGFVFALVTIVKKMANPEMVAGWASTISVTLILGGLIILLIGIVGEYIGRIYLSINNSPQYVVRNVVDRRAGEACPTELPASQAEQTDERPSLPA